VRVSSLRIYPVKSTAGIDVREAVVHPWGLHNDRRWMVVDPEGETVTARSVVAVKWGNAHGANGPCCTSTPEPIRKAGVK